MKIHFLKANAGDCILLEFDKKCVLIDGGYQITYDNYLKPLLYDLSSKEKSIEYLVLTHFDSDHISGLIKLVKENGQRGKEKIIPIENIICNNFSSLYEKHYRDTIAIRKPISYKQQKSFEQYCVENGYSLPTKVVAGCLYSGTGYEIKIVSPDIKDLENCFSDFEEISSKKIRNPISGRLFSDIYQWKELPVMGSPLNKANCASIAFEISFEEKHLLFCGDANMNKYKKMLSYDSYEIIKLSHHGTYYGNECFVGEKPIVADCYMISTNGQKEEHPNRKLLSEILVRNRDKRILLNHRLKRVQNNKYDLLFSEEQQNKYNFKTDIVRVFNI